MDLISRVCDCHVSIFFCCSSFTHRTAAMSSFFHCSSLPSHSHDVLVSTVLLYRRTATTLFFHSHQSSTGLSSQFKHTVTLVPNEPSYRPIFCRRYRPIFCRRGVPKMTRSHTICAHQFCCYQWGLPLSCLSSHSLNGTVVSHCFIGSLQRPSFVCSCLPSARRNGRCSFALSHASCVGSLQWPLFVLGC